MSLSFWPSSSYAWARKGAEEIFRKWKQPAIAAEIIVGVMLSLAI
jgi:Kef-type K+ transport system membrane component KefB